jgi:hypothetical protein
MPILCVARWRVARGTAQWLFTQERLHPEVAIIHGGSLPPSYSWKQP